MAFPVDLGNTLFTALGGIAGYAFREYENRITPFLQVSKIEGDSMRLEDRVNIPEDISSRLKDSCFIGSLGPSARLGDAFSVWDRAEDMNLFWPSCDNHVARFLNAHDQKDAIDDLTKLFEFKLIDESLSTLLRQNHIIIPSIPNEGAGEIEICFVKETAFINFPEGVRSFGGTMGLLVVWASGVAGSTVRAKRSLRLAATTAARRMRSTGLAMKSSMPASRHLARSLAKALAVRPTMRTVLAGPSSSRMRRVASRPSMTGICISMNTRS